MNFFLTDRQADVIRKGGGSPAVIGNVNPSIIAAGVSTKVFEITNNIGSDFHVLGISIRYPATFDSVLINLNNTQKNKQIFTGSTALGAVGVSSALSSDVSIMPIVPFILTSGNFAEVFINNNTANPFPVRGLLVSLYGMQLD